MKLRDLLLTSSESIRRNTSRSLLTMLGIIIGIAAVILMLSIGQGAQGYVLNQVADLGSDQIFVESGSGDQESGPPNPFQEQTLTLDDVEALRRRGPFSFVSPTLLSTATVESAEAQFLGDIAGVDQDQLLVFPASVRDGRFIDADDVKSYAKVVVLGTEIAEDLFGDQDAVGQKISIKGVKFRVIGVLNEQGARFFQNLDRRLYVPVTTMQRDVAGVDYVNFIAARAVGDLESAKDEARYILRDTHGIDNPEGDLAKDDFAISSQAEAANTIGAVGTALTFLLAAIAAISLFVGGIGIMNIMLVSVTERTKEIGLRKAIGATQSEILRQFLVEAVLLTVTGGLLGVAIGVTLSLVIGWGVSSAIDGWPVVIPPTAIVVSFVVSTVVGLGFGIYPARRAAALDPIDALRFE